ncbi:MAG: polysaccharide biosynthesis C-terminal domain-containing protein [Alphaproteobacteria bacterium]|nr:polysaccharide biosynthesis C-terminal domain-containing protein [Alphaproteobacteria bacterium]
MKKKSVFLDIILNYNALLLGGLSGILINIIISYTHGPRGLGVFNQIYAFYVILSQLAVGGIHLSALKHVAGWQGSSATLGRIAWSSFFLSFPISVFFAILCYLSSFVMNIVLSSSQVSQGIRYVSVALIFFSCNKIMLFILNALQEMRLLAFWQAMRYILMILSVCALIYLESNVYELGLSFTFSEAILFIGLLFSTLYKIPQLHKGFSATWMKKHFNFGLRGICNGILIELNTRVDILILGIFSSDITVGLYSFSSMLIEGILGFLVVIRNQMNPFLAKLLKERNFAEIQRYFKKFSYYMFGSTFLILIMAAFTFDPLLAIFLELNPFLESYYFFLILLAGVCIYSVYFPFDNILLLAGYPGKQSLLAFFSTTINILLNFALIPLWGAYGAAIGTSLAMIFSLVFFKILTKKYLHLSLDLPRIHFSSQLHHSSLNCGVD